MGFYGWCWGFYYSPGLARLREAWTEHYMRKGCSQWKARNLAQKKTHTWPPTAPR